MRIASLVPSSTEMLFALDAGDSVVAVTHECDYPPGVVELPHLTRSFIPEGLNPLEIDAAVRERTEQGESLYELDEELLHDLDPELIVTQDVCEVCAVSYDDVVAVAQRLTAKPDVISLDPSTIGEVLADMPRLAEAIGNPAAGERLTADATERLDRVREAVEGARRPRVAALEWLAPVFVAGHWVPQMIDIAGGEDVLGLPGERSRTAEWEEVQAAGPEIVVVMPCGYEAQRAAFEGRGYGEKLLTLGGRAVAVDAAAYFSRPGPRLVDGVELLAHVFHPDLVEAPPEGRVMPVDLGPGFPAAQDFSEPAAS